ncbi:MAG: glycosyltransferase [Candidatus Binatia bacterium]
MKVLLAATMHNEGLQSRGFSYEHYNLFQTLEQIVSPVTVFDFMQVLQQRGRVQMNQDLLEAVLSQRPDVVIVAPYTDQLMPGVIDEIGRHTITVGYFFDDMWRIEYARFWAGHFSFVTTSDVNGVLKFRDAGYSNVIYSPFACNHRIFAKRDLPKKIDVSFVGQYHPYRAWCLQYLKRAGIPVQVWGQGWGTGRLSQDQMIAAFNQSRINLNLSNSTSWDVRYMATLARPIRESLRAWRDCFRSIRQPDAKVHEQVKGRHFEINACGGFQLSYYVEGLERHYRIGEEIALYASPEEMVEKTRYYLKHEDERESIAQRGHERTLREHSMEERFRKIFVRIGLPGYGPA